MVQPLVVLVVGAGRSGTSTLAGALNHLGLDVPAPQVGADASNPRGHFEPLWAVRFHKRILAASGHAMVDGDPLAGRHSMQVARAGQFTPDLRKWLSATLKASPRVIIKDPRTVWVAPLWAEVVKSLGARVVMLTMLRDAPGVIGSHSFYYGKRAPADRQPREESALLTGWVNLNLVAEAVSRDHDRLTILYDDLLKDWRSALRPLQEDFKLPLDLSADGEAAQEVDAFIDPELHRIHREWAGSQIPAPLREVADALWVDLKARARGEIEEPIYVERMAAHRAGYANLFRASDMIARDRKRRAVRDARQAGYREALQGISKHIESLR